MFLSQKSFRSGAIFGGTSWNFFSAACDMRDQISTRSSSNKTVPLSPLRLNDFTNIFCTSALVADSAIRLASRLLVISATVMSRFILRSTVIFITRHSQMCTSINGPKSRRRKDLLNPIGALSATNTCVLQCCTELQEENYEITLITRT